MSGSFIGFLIVKVFLFSLTSKPKSRKILKWKSKGRLPILSPPGYGRETLQNLAKRGPIITTDPRIFDINSVFKYLGLIFLLTTLI